MANRHNVQAKKGGGGVTPKHDAHKEAYNAKGSNVVKEAEEEKRGGKVKHKATGGEVKAPGKKSGGRLDKRARGGGVNKLHKDGGDMKSSPFSAAHTGHGGNAAENPAVHKGK